MSQEPQAGTNLVLLSCSCQALVRDRCIFRCRTRRGRSVVAVPPPPPGCRPSDRAPSRAAPGRRCRPANVAECSGTAARAPPRAERCEPLQKALGERRPARLPVGPMLVVCREWCHPRHSSAQELEKTEQTEVGGRRTSVAIGTILLIVRL